MCQVCCRIESEMPAVLLLEVFVFRNEFLEFLLVQLCLILTKTASHLSFSFVNCNVVSVSKDPLTSHTAIEIKS